MMASDDVLRGQVRRAMGRVPVPTLDLSAVQARAAAPRARRPHLTRTWMVGAAAMVALALGAPVLARSVPDLYHVVISALHLTVVAREPGGQTLAQSAQGFRYTIGPARCKGAGPCGISIETSARTVSLAQAERDAAGWGFRVIPPAGLPTGAHLVAIREPGPMPGQPNQVWFQLRTASGGQFTIQEIGPPHVVWQGTVTTWVQDGTQIVISNGNRVLTAAQRNAIRSAMLARQPVPAVSAGPARGRAGPIARP